MIVTLHEGSINDIKGVWAHSHCVPFYFYFFLSRNKESEIPTIFVEAQEPKKTKQGIHVYLFCETHLSSY